MLAAASWTLVLITNSGSLAAIPVESSALCVIAAEQFSGVPKQWKASDIAVAKCAQTGAEASPSQETVSWLDRVLARLQGSEK
jgi:hypothetical protein